MFINKDKYNYLLLIPFIVTPLLISSQFSDPTLIIKRTSVFIFFSIIGLFFLFSRLEVRSISRLQLQWIICGLFLIGYIYITSLNYSLNLSESHWGALYLMGWFGISILFSCYSNDRVMVLLCMITSLVGGVISIISLLDYFNLFNYKLISFSTGTFGNRNFWGMYLCFVIPSTIFSTLIAKSKKHSLIHFSIFLISFFSLLQTRSRSAWLGIFIGFIFLLIFFNKEIISWIRSIRIYRTLPMMLILFFFIFFYQSQNNQNQGFPEFKQTVISTILSIKDIGDEEVWGYRIPMYMGTLSMIKDHLFFGVGYHNWRFQYPKYSGHLVNDSNYLKITQRPHNDLLWILSEVGIVGLLLYFTVIGMPIVYSTKRFVILKREDNSDKILIYGFILMSIISIFSESLFDFPRQRTIPNLYLWSFVGYLVSQLSSKKIAGNFIDQIIKWVVIFIIGIVTYYSINDYKSNIYSHNLLYFKDNQRYGDAIKSGERALFYGRNVDNSGTPIYFYMGVSEYQRGNRLESENLFKRSLKVSPYHLGALENYMILMGKNKKMNISLETMNFSQYIYPNYYGILLNMIKLYLQNYDFDSAKKIIYRIDSDIKINKRLDRYDSVDKKIKQKLRHEITKLYQYISEAESK